MQPNTRLERARLLMDRGRYTQAAEELRLALRDDPEDAMLHAYLAMCLMEDPARLEAAWEEALGATVKDPLQALAWFAVSRVQGRRGAIDSAEQAVRIALSLNAEAPLLYAQLADLQALRLQWRASLETADRGLAVDPDDAACANLRAEALSRLGRHEEAYETLRRVLARAPEDAATHANAGWGRLRAGDARAALEHFRESLRLDPTRARAREGMMEALKAHNAVYRAFLRAGLRVPVLPPSSKWLAIGVGVAGSCVIWLAVHDAGLPEIVALPFQAALLVAMVLTWTAGPLFDLLLFFDPVGRETLTRAQRIGSVALAAVLAVASVLAVAYLAGAGGGFGFAAALAVLFTIPVTAALRATPGRARALTLAYSLLPLAASAAFLVLQARESRGAATWFGLAVGAMSIADLVSDYLSGRM